MKIAPKVGFCQAIKLAFKNYAKSNGRSRRSEFWNFYLFATSIVLGFTCLMILLVFITLSNKRLFYIIINILSILLIILSLIIAIPTICLIIRRLHDTGKPGTYIFLSFIPFGGIIILYFCCIDSEVNTNEYGPSPKYISPQNDPLNPNNSTDGIPLNSQTIQSQSQPSPNQEMDP